MLTSEERLEMVDREVEELKRAFIEAATEIQGAPELDASFDERWNTTALRIRNLRTDVRPEDYDKQQLAEAYAAIFDMRDALDDGRRDLDTIDSLLIAMERIRHVVRDALDEHVSGIGGDKGLVVGELIDALPGVSRETIAELVGVDRRTLTRWRGESGKPSARLRTVARLVKILQHNWTEDGIVAWFQRPRRDLDGAKPIAALNARALDEDALIAAARAGRSHYAA